MYLLKPVEPVNLDSLCTTQCDKMKVLPLMAFGRARPMFYSRWIVCVSLPASKLWNCKRQWVRFPNLVFILWVSFQKKRQFTLSLLCLAHWFLFDTQKIKVRKINVFFEPLHSCTFNFLLCSSILNYIYLLTFNSLRLMDDDVVFLILFSVAI